MLLGFPVMVLVVHERHEKARKKRFRMVVDYRSHAPRGNAVSNAPALRFTSKQRWSVGL